MLHLTRDQGRGIANYRAIMVTRIERERAMLDVYRIDLPTGAHSVVCENQGFAGSIPGPGGAIRFAARVSSSGGRTGPSSVRRYACQCPLRAAA
jgi:hypothetical protein